MLKTKTMIAIICAIFLLVTLSCNGCTEIGSPHLQKITDEYYFVSTISDVSIMKCSREKLSTCETVIDFGVIDTDWSEKFIVAKKTVSELANETWYIIDVANDKLHGPYSYDEYLQERETLAVPSDMELLVPGENEWEAYHRKH